MRRVFGPRTVVEAAFLVAVPVVAAAIGSGMWTIIAASAVAYLLIFVLEATLWREGRTAPSLPGLRLPARHVVVKQPEPQAEPADTVASVESVPPARRDEAQARWSWYRWCQSEGAMRPMGGVVVDVDA